ncbi:hypothetical protein BD779DRAFT_1459301 [Infundibulicybe gibba]|nr:hypothetical protein BD779DRAFT_1459301 [Infundibulicybe gibba]
MSVLVNRSPSACKWVENWIKKEFDMEVENMLSREKGWQFKAVHASAQQIERFQIEEMAEKMAKHAPKVWGVLGSLVSDQRSLARGNKTNIQDGSREDRMEVDDPEDDIEDYWSSFDTVDLEGIIESLTATPLIKQNLKEKRRNSIIQIKKVVILSIIMQSRNQKTNTLESIIGIFLHSCKTPEKVIEALAHMGISISTSSIHRAITALSAESAKGLRDLGQTLLASYAYDNFDVDLKMAVPTVERSTDTLKHLTSALLFPLQHGVMQEDMRCSEQLWRNSRLNPEAVDVPAEKTWKDLLGLHPEAKHSSGLTRRERFNAWMFLRDLCDHGPEYFKQFRSKLQEPEVIEQIPIIKTPTLPARAMDLSNSTVSGNIETIKNLAAQGGIGDPDDPEEMFEVTDLREHVLLFHGDLGTGD